MTKINTKINDTELALVELRSHLTRLKRRKCSMKYTGKSLGEEVASKVTTQPSKLSWTSKGQERTKGTLRYKQGTAGYGALPRG